MNMVINVISQAFSGGKPVGKSQNDYGGENPETYRRGRFSRGGRSKHGRWGKRGI